MGKGAIRRFIRRRVVDRIRPCILAENVLRRDHSRKALIVYITEPFLGDMNAVFHQNRWQVTELARALDEAGFIVDVIDALRPARVGKAYDLIIDLHPCRRPPYRNACHESTRMIAYITGSNPRFSVEEERKRIAAVNQRRPVRLRTVREVPLFESAVFASFDAMFFIGNEYNLKSYSDLTLPPVYFIPNTGYEHLLRLPVPAEDRSPGEFIFLGSAGQVHKGLDLLLEIFPRHPELNLHVCSPFEGEPDFCRAYAKELYQTRNVHAHGFVDIAGEKFSRLCRRCTYQVLPSCSEARAGAVITGMSAGLIPIISEPCGFDREDGGIVFEDCSIETVERTLLEAAGRDHDWRKRESARIRERVRSHYMPEVYGRRIREVISQVIDGKHGDGTT